MKLAIKGCLVELLASAKIALAMIFFFELFLTSASLVRKMFDKTVSHGC